jgi:hypothetical protein
MSGDEEIVDVSTASPSWVRRILGHQRQRAENRHRRRRRASASLWMESLEARLVMAAPSVTSPTVTGVTPYQAVLGGNVTSDGGSPLSFRGIVYALTSVNPNPTRGGIGVAEIDAPGVPGAGVFTVTATPLTPNTKYSFRAFATNADGTTYSPITTLDASTFTTLPPNLMLPKDSFTPDPNDPNRLLNNVLYFGPTKNDTNPLHFEIPLKTITFTNNADFTVFPILVNTNATKDDLKPTQALYDPIDPMFNEYRGYIGHRDASGSYVGLLPGMSITVPVPLVFWDGARIFIGYDPTYMDMTNNAPQVGQALTIPNPFQYYAKNKDGSNTVNVTLPAISVSDAPAGRSGVVMWYRQGLPINDPKQPIGPSNDAPAQLAEFTIRDPILSKINPNIDKLKPNFGETHALINYDVSYVDNMTLPVAMAALDVPIPITDPPLPVQTPFPGPRLPYGWIGSSQTVDQFQKAAAEFLSLGPTNGLGSYFGLSGDNVAPNYNGWTQYNFDVTNGVSPAFGKTPLIKLPSGQDALSDSPLGDVSSSYDVNANSYMLTSGGTDAKQVLGAGSAFTNGSKSLYVVANTPALQNILRTQLQKGMVVKLPNGGPGAPVVPAGTVVERIGPVGNPGFNFTKFTPTGGGETEVLEIGLSNVIAASGNQSYSYTLTRPVTDYISNALVNLWYTWANYYITNLPASAQDQSGLAGQSIPDAKEPAAKNNVIRLAAANTHLVPGMVVTGSGISTNPVDGKTTIVAIDADNRTIHLSQGVLVGSQGTYNFRVPAMADIGGYDDSIVKLLTPFAPVATPSVPNVNQFAQNAYQLLSFMGQVPSGEDDASPRSVQIVHNVIGGNVTKPTNLDALHKIEVAYRTMVKSLLRGVNDFTKQLDQSLWYPDPSKPMGGQSFNIFNLDPFVWFVHQRLGLSGYGFSLDDDAADIGANYATKLGVSIGGLNGLPNHVEWTETAPFGPVSGTATVLSLGDDTLKPPSITFPYEISGLPQYVWYSVKALDTMNSVPGAQVIGNGVSPGTFLNSGGDAAQTKYAFSLANSKNLPPLTSAIGSSTQYTMFYGGTPNTTPLQLQGGSVVEAVSPFTNSSTVRIPVGDTLKIKTEVGSLTSYTQQIQQFTRAGTEPLSMPLTVVRGVLDAGRVNIADGRLAGVGTITGSLDLLAPLKAYTYVDSLGKTVTIRETFGGILQPGGLDDTPGRLTVGSPESPKDVRLYGGTFMLNAKGGSVPGTDYSQLVSYGNVSLGKNALFLFLNFGDYVPQPGESLTIISTTGEISGQFIQGTSMTVRGITYKITYNKNSVVLTRSTALHGTAFQDHDADGFRDGIDHGLAARTVFLDGNNNGVLDGSEERTLTDAGGRFSFANLDAGTHRVRMVAPTGGTPTHVRDVVLTGGETRFGQDVGVRINDATRNVPLTPLLYTVPRTAATLNAGLLDTVFQGLLGRPAQDPGRSAFLRRLNSGTPLSTVVREIVGSSEYRNLQVQKYYGDFLGRQASPAELRMWGDMVAAGRSWTSVIAGILTSQEFRDAGNASNVAFVQSAYRLLLGREQGPTEGAGWVARLDGGSLTRSGLVHAFVGSAEAQMRLLSSAYSGWLKRPVDDAGRALWLPRLVGGMTFEDLAVSIFTSQEVRTRVLRGQG